MRSRQAATAARWPTAPARTEPDAGEARRPGPRDRAQPVGDRAAALRERRRAVGGARATRTTSCPSRSQTQRRSRGSPAAPRGAPACRGGPGNRRLRRRRGQAVAERAEPAAADRHPGSPSGCEGGSSSSAANGSAPAASVTSGAQPTTAPHPGPAAGQGERGDPVGDQQRGVGRGEVSGEPHASRGRARRDGGGGRDGGRARGVGGGHAPTILTGGARRSGRAPGPPAPHGQPAVRGPASGATEPGPERAGARRGRRRPRRRSAPARRSPPGGAARRAARRPRWPPRRPRSPARGRCG